MSFPVLTEPIEQRPNVDWRPAVGDRVRIERHENMHHGREGLVTGHTPACRCCVRFDDGTSTFGIPDESLVPIRPEGEVAT